MLVERRGLFLLVSSKSQRQIAEMRLVAQTASVYTKSISIKPLP